MNPQIQIIADPKQIRDFIREAVADLRQPVEKEPALTIQDAAKALSCTEGHVRKMIRDGKLIAGDIGTGKGQREYRISAREIARVLGE